MVTGEHILYFDERIYEQFKSNICVFSDSVLCIGGKCPDHPEAARLLRNDRIKHFVESPEYRPIYDLTGELVELVWKIYVERTSTDILEYIQKMLEEGVQPSHFKGMSMYNDVSGGKPRTKTYAISTHFSDLETKKMVRTRDRKTMGKWNSIFSLEQAPCVQVLISIIKRRAQSKVSGRTSIHYKTDPSSAVMLMNQLSIYKAVLIFCTLVNIAR